MPSRRCSAFALVVGSLLSLAPRPARAIDKVAAACIEASEKAQTLQDEGKYAHATEHYLACAAEQCPAVLRADCNRFLAELRRIQPSIVIVARDAKGIDLRDVEVRIDGRQVLTHLDGRPIELDPGDHAIELVAAGQVQRERIVVASGEKDRLITSTSNLPASRPAAEPRPAPASPVRPARPSFLGPIVLGGVGLANLGVMALVALGAHGDLVSLENSSCATTKTCSPSKWTPSARAPT